MNEIKNKTFMKRRELIKTLTGVAGGYLILGCEHDSLTNSLQGAGNKFTLDSAKRWYESKFSINNKARLAGSNFTPKWEIGWDFTLENGDDRVAVPIKFLDDSLPGLALRQGDQTSDQKKPIDVANYGKVNLIMTQQSNGDILPELLVALPDKNYIEKKYNVVEGYDFTGELLFFDTDLNKLQRGFRMENGLVVKSYIKENPDPKARPNLYQVCVDHYYFTCYAGTCTQPTLSYTDCYAVDLDDGSGSGGDSGGSISTGGGGGGGSQPTPIVNYSKYNAQSTDYVNLYSYMEEGQDWTDLDKPCDSFNYNGESNLSNSELWVKILTDEAMDILGIRDIAALLSILTGANLINTRQKVGMATKGTSILSKYVSPLIPGNSPIRLPTVTGFPGFGQGARIMFTRNIGRFITRGIPVIGWGIAAYELYNIINNTINKHEQTVQAQSGGC